MFLHSVRFSAANPVSKLQKQEMTRNTTVQVRIDVTWLQKRPFDFFTSKITMRRDFLVFQAELQISAFYNRLRQTMPLPYLNNPCFLKKITS